MATQIVLNLDSQPGSMARAITALRRFGLTLSKHRIAPVSDGLFRLVILAEGPFSERELTDSLEKIRGVQEVVRVGVTHTDSAPSGNKAKPVGRGVSGSTVDPVDEIISSFPRILSIIEGYEQQVRHFGNRKARLKDLGGRVGRKMISNDESIKSATTIHEALQNAVVPALKPISDIEAFGSELRVRISIFTSRQVNTMDLDFSGEASHCDFLSGIIQGMINVSDILPEVFVEEHACRTNGDDFCLFRVSA